MTDEDLAEGAVYPALSRIRECSFAVACATIRRAVAEGQATPEMLEDLERTRGAGHVVPRVPAGPLRTRIGPGSRNAAERSQPPLRRTGSAPVRFAL